mgnify:CR=1 FL=1|tara:strand:+ start:17 stop:1177 length:1161 start_codon:yes stop_codon:yes gene_type:complete
MHQSSQGIYKTNILLRSLNAEVFKSTLGILTIFFFLVVGSRFVGYFEQAAEGAINPNLIYKIVLLRIPDFITLLIPLSFFLGLVISISRLYADREIYGYFSVGLSRNDLIKFLFPQAAIFFLITLTLSIYIAPYTKELSRELISADSLEEQLESIRPKEVVSFNNADNFIYADSRDDDSIKDLVIYITNQNTSSFVIAEELNYQNEDQSTILSFEEGFAYQNIFRDESGIISRFGNLKIPVKNDFETISGLSLSKLFDFSSKSSKSEMYWNISIPITIFILLVIGVYLSKVNPRQGRLSALLPAIFVYILYLSLLILGRESYENDTSYSHLYIWLAHLIFIIFAIFLVFKNNLIGITRLIESTLKSNYLKIIIFILIALIFLWIVR